MIRKRYRRTRCHLVTGSRKRLFLAVTVLLSAEIVVARIMAPFVGMSLDAWTVVIATGLVLAGITRLLATYLRLLAIDMVDVMGGVGISSIIVLSVLMFFAPSFFAGIVVLAATTVAM